MIIKHTYKPYLYFVKKVISEAVNAYIYVTRLGFHSIFYQYFDTFRMVTHFAK
jgi:hypothetical protein